MTTNIETLTRPLTPEAWASIHRAARQERARAMSARGRSLMASLKRAFTVGTTITVWVPSAKGGHISA